MEATNGLAAILRDALCALLRMRVSDAEREFSVPAAMTRPPTQVAIIGAGPAGLMAAEVLAQAGQGVTVFDAMSSAGRKFLMAGRGGLNLTHSEDRKSTRLNSNHANKSYSVFFFKKKKKKTQ